MMDLIQAFKDRFESDATLTSLGYTSLYFKTEPPRNGSGAVTTPPYAVQLFAVDPMVIDAFGTRHVEKSVIQVCLYDSNITGIDSALDALKSRFDRWAGTSPIISVQRTSQGTDYPDSTKTDGFSNPIYYAWARFTVQADRSF